MSIPLPGLDRWHSDFAPPLGFHFELLPAGPGQAIVFRAAVVQRALQKVCLLRFHKGSPIGILYEAYQPSYRMSIRRGSRKGLSKVF